MADQSNGQSLAWPSEAATAADFAQEGPIWLAEAVTAADFKGGGLGGCSPPAPAGRNTTLSSRVLISEGSVSNLIVDPMTLLSEMHQFFVAWA